MPQIAEKSGEMGKLLHMTHVRGVFHLKHTQLIPKDHGICALDQGQNLHRNKQVFPNTDMNNKKITNI